MKTILPLLLLVPSLHAANFTLDFSSLPSAQGWSYDGYTESSVFSLSNSTLTQSTLGIGYDPSYYHHQGLLSNGQPFAISLRARLLQEELEVDGQAFAVQVTYSSGQGDDLLGLGLTGSGVVVFGNSRPFSTALPVDTSQFHDYLLTGRPSDGQWELFVDGARATNGIMPLGQGLPVERTIVYLGDLTDASNARAELTRLAIVGDGPPPLGIRPLDSSRVQLSWTANTVPYNLEFTDSLPATLWQPVTNSVAVVGSEYVVTTESTSPARFFRLR